MNYCRSNQFGVNQGNQSATDSLPKMVKALRYTIKCHPESPANIIVGINEPANPANLLQPGESLTIGVDGFYVQDDIYIDFVGATAGGKALCIVQLEMPESYCP